jgi:CO dehydrogenase maturation factor
LIHDRSFIAPGVYNLNPYVDDILEKYSSKKGRIKLLTMGTIEKGGEGCTCPENAFLRAVLRHILRRDEFLILDTEAGIEHLGRKIAQDFDLMLVVVEPSAKAVETANRIHDLSMQIGIKNTYAIGNKIASEEQRDFIKKMLKFQVMDFIPFDEDLLRADMRGEPLTKCAPFFNAIERISKGITSMRKATSKYGTNLSD